MLLREGEGSLLRFLAEGGGGAPFLWQFLFYIEICLGGPPFLPGGTPFCGGTPLVNQCNFEKKLKCPIGYSGLLRKKPLQVDSSFHC